MRATLANGATIEGTVAEIRAILDLNDAPARETTTPNKKPRVTPKETAKRPKRHYRRRKTYQRWSLADDHELLAKKAQGWSQKRLARHLKRTTIAIADRVRTLKLAKNRPVGPGERIEIPVHTLPSSYPGRYTCSICGKTVRSPAALGAHKAFKHRITRQGILVP